ncbi:hypothetical protein RB653_005914 [Dictyostelium firmibasis]|uniref:MRH domain-containing protein n=1 Tax=Dictyostelium firmibasis TaxID=79012 RepID=A0AAN7UAF3_9MYCE
MNSVTKLLIFFLLISTIKSQTLYSSINQTNNIVDIHLNTPLFQINITNVEYLANDVESTLNSCYFSSNSFSMDLRSLKGVEHILKDSFGSTYYFSLCSATKSCKSGAQSCLNSDITGYSSNETFGLGNLGVDDFALSLTYKNPGKYDCPTGSFNNYFFQCNQNEEFNIAKYNLNIDSNFACHFNITIQTKYVCSSNNVPIISSKVNYSLIQPNIVRIILDESSTNIIKFNNSIIQFIPIKPIIYSCYNNDSDIITVNGLFFADYFKSHYTFNFNNSISLPISKIISFNSSTIVLNSSGVVDNNFFISLDGVQSDTYSILKSHNQLIMTAVYDESKMLYINCTNCIGSILKGFRSTIILGLDMYVSIDLSYQSFSDDAIYLEAPISPFKRSNILALPTNFSNIIFSGNEVFQFDGTSIISIRGFFIPKTYNNQTYIIGKLQFLNGTIYNLEYKTNDNGFSTTGYFNVPYGYGNGTFSIYINNSSNLVHSNSFSYKPSTSRWVTSMSQNLDKVKLQLSFSHLFYNISSIKYNNINGTELKYQLVEPNIIIFTLDSDSSTTLSFNNDYHIEDISVNGYNPVIYNYSMNGNVMTMDGLFISKSIPNYKFYLGDIKTLVSANNITYFTSSKISLVLNQFLDLYVYSDNKTFTKVPDIALTSDEVNLIYTCSNCFGGYINGFDSQNNQDKNFSEIGTIVKTFNRNTTKILNAYTFTKDSITKVLNPPSPSFDNSVNGYYQFSSFTNGSISISGNFLYDKYNGSDYTLFELHFDDGRIYEPQKKILSNSAQHYKYLINVQLGFGSGNFTTSVVNLNGTKSIVNSTPFKYPSSPIIHSIRITDDENSPITIQGDGFFGDVIVTAAFKRVVPYYYNGPNTDIFKCSRDYSYNIESTSIFTCYILPYQFNSSIYYIDAPITFQLISYNYNSVFNPVYFQTKLEIVTSNDISLHSVISKLIITITILITILIQ